MGLETTVFYRFHPLYGRTLPVVDQGKEAVTVVAPGERHLKIPTWMTRPEAAGHEVSEQAAIAVRALFALSESLPAKGPEPHATLSEPETTPAAGGEDEAVGARALPETLEDQGRADGLRHARAARSVDGGDDRGGCTRNKEARR